MKLFSQYLKNVIRNFPPNHAFNLLAMSQLEDVLRFERECDGPSIETYILEWALDPLDYELFN